MTYEQKLIQRVIVQTRGDGDSYVCLVNQVIDPAATETEFARQFHPSWVGSEFKVWSSRMDRMGAILVTVWK